ncbi:MAG: hypothetical protein HC890_08195 [Chloroflexaceae bacterium]|nr:hypothetical protein [Chloroflexaceae bacterium]
MRQDVLTLLGCSGSVAIALMAAQPALANVPASPEFVFAAPGYENYEVTEAFDCGCSGDASAQAAKWAEEEAQAIAKFGCDCAGCRQLIRNQPQ